MPDPEENKSKEFWGGLPSREDLDDYFDDETNSKDSEAAEELSPDSPWQEEAKSFSLSAKEKGVSTEKLLDEKEDKEIEEAIAHSWSAFALGEKDTAPEKEAELKRDGDSIFEEPEILEDEEILEEPKPIEELSAQEILKKEEETGEKEELPGDLKYLLGKGHAPDKKLTDDSKQSTDKKTAPDNELPKPKIVESKTKQKFKYLVMAILLIGAAIFFLWDKFSVQTPNTPIAKTEETQDIPFQAQKKVFLFNLTEKFPDLERQADIIPANPIQAINIFSDPIKQDTSSVFVDTDDIIKKLLSKQDDIEMDISFISSKRKAKTEVPSSVPLFENFHDRTLKKEERINLVKFGQGSTKTEQAMEYGLDWLFRHQSLDASKQKWGFWMEAAYVYECAGYQRPKTSRAGQNSDIVKFPGVCSPEALTKKQLKDLKQKPLFTKEKHSPGMTGLALLAFAGAGQTHKRGKYKKTIAKTLNFLVANILKNGRIAETEKDPFYKVIRNKIKKNRNSSFYEPFKFEMGSPMYQHSILSYAVGEMYTLSKDAYLKTVYEKMIEQILKSRGTDLGWRYDYGGDKFSSLDEPGDMSASSWALMALRVAKLNGVLKSASKNLGTTQLQVWDDLRKYIEFCRDDIEEEKFKYMSTKNSFLPGPGYFGLLGLNFLYDGKGRRAMSRPLATKIWNNIKDDANYWETNNKKGAPTQYHYYHYCNTLSFYQYGGKIWKLYNELNVKRLLKSQNTKLNCSHGSWGAPKTRGGFNQSRVYATALSTLQLQTYYRYRRVKKDGADFAKKVVNKFPKIVREDKIKIEKTFILAP